MAGKNGWAVLDGPWAQPSAERAACGEPGAPSVWRFSLCASATSGATAFVTVKNLADKVYIVDRTRGIQVGSPRLVQAGLTVAFSAGQ